MKELFFKDWETLYHILICATISYLTLFLFIRISGKRTLAKLTAFDFVVAVTLGSMLSSTILLQVKIFEGLTGLALIIALQYLLALITKKSDTMKDVINSVPTLLFYNGTFFKEAMNKELVKEEEIYAEIRQNSIERIDDVRAVVLELNGSMTVIKKSDLIAHHTSLDDGEIE